MAQEDSTKKRSIVIMDMPEEFIDREVLKDHFEAFGTVERLACSVSKKYAVIHFSTPEEAENAVKNGTKIRPDAPPLKIYHRAVSIGSHKAAPSPTFPAPPPPTSSRVITRRKIIRTFPHSGSGQHPTNPATSPVMSGQGLPPAPTSSTPATQNQPMYSKSSIKVSRPSPILRKRSFGDKAGKPGSPSVTAPRNPFALPSRSMLSLDRRKKTFPSSTNTSASASSEVKIAQPSLSSSSSKPEKLTVTAVFSNRAEASSTAQQSTSSRQVKLDSTRQQNVKVETSPSSAEAPISSQEHIASSSVDIDEDTEDVTGSDRETETDAVPNAGADDDDEYNVLAEAETDTQDTAEVTTEEEGEIGEDDDENDEDYQPEEDEENYDDDEEDDNDTYESPLKRAAAKATKQTNVTTPAPAPLPTADKFAFKLSPASKESSKPSSASLFKVPFSSPFAVFGETLKPASTSSGGFTFNVPTSANIFSGAPRKEESSVFPKVSTDERKPSENVTVAAKLKDAGASSSLEPGKSRPFGLFQSVFGSSTSTVSTGLISSSSSSTNSSSPFVMAAESANTAKMGEGGKSLLPSSTSSLIFSSLGKPSSSTTQSSSKPPPIIKPGAPMPSSSTATNLATAPKDTPNPLLLTFNPDTPEAQELFAKRAMTVEDRYRMLEARDKIIRSRIPKTKVNVEFATKLIGTCPDMCPEKERYMRQFQRQLVPYEMVLASGQEPAVDHYKAVKVYSRSSADQEEPLPHELRPASTLDFTMNYLLRFIVPLGDNPDEQLSDWYNFLWDRTRSIRKDITQQQIIDLTAVSLFEKCARFHIHCASRLCELDVHSFDPKLNDENLMKCLQSLEHLYEDLRRRKVNCPSEPEFRAYQIMMNLNEGDALYNAQQLPSWILNSAEVQTALKLHHSINTKNFVRFFGTVERSPYMTSCILHRYFFQVRSLALRCFIKAHCTLPKYETAMPMSTLQRMLGYGPDGGLSFSYLCDAHGIHCDTEESKVILKRKMFYLPEMPTIYRERFLIDSKLYTSVSEAINGGPLPNIDMASRRPLTSFNDNGQLIPGNVVGSYESKSATVFLPLESSPFPKPELRARPLIQAPVIPSIISFGTPQFQKKETQERKSIKEIDVACQAATAKLIEDSIQRDVAQLSRARLEEAKIAQERAERKRLQEQIATTLSCDYVDKIIMEHVEAFVRTQSVSHVRKFQAVEEMSRSAVGNLVEEVLLANINLTASTEITTAIEVQNRLTSNLSRIFGRVRARFGIQKWKRFTKSRKLAREMAEEKRWQKLWNFPAINPYSFNSKDVLKALCGKSDVYPIMLNKADSLKSPENTKIGSSAKRKSEGETTEHDTAMPHKLPRLSTAEIPENIPKLLWEFPVIDSYSRTNRQVLEAFCGDSTRVPISSKITTFDSSGRLNSSSSIDANTSFKIHRPPSKISTDHVSQAIKSKASEGTAGLIANIQNFLDQVRDERRKMDSLEEIYSERIKRMKETYPEIDASPIACGESMDDSSVVPGVPDEPKWMDMRYSADRMSNIFSAGRFFEHELLLSKIQRFVQDVRDEKGKSWNTDTFLNDIHLDSV